MSTRTKPHIVVAVTLAAVLAVAAAVAAVPGARLSASAGGLVNESAYAVQAGDWRRAVRLAGLAVRDGGLDAASLAAAHNALCIGYTQLGKFDDAGAACDQAVQLSPGAWSHLGNRGNLRFRLGRYGDAVADYQKAAALSPGNAVVMQNLELAAEMLAQHAEKAVSSL